MPLPLPPSATPQCVMLPLQGGPGSSFGKQQSGRLWCSPWPMRNPRKDSSLRTTIILIWRWQGRKVLWCSSRSGGRHRLITKESLFEWLCLSVRQIRFQLDEQPIKQTHLHSWKWRTKIQPECSGGRQEVSTRRGICYFTPEFCYSTRIRSLLESHNLVPPHSLYQSIVSLSLHFPLPIPSLCTK